MVISNLNYVEIITETSEVEGGLRQIAATTQSNIIGVGNNGRNGISIGNVGLGINLDLSNIAGLEALNFS